MSEGELPSAPCCDTHQPAAGSVAPPPPRVPTINPLTPSACADGVQTERRPPRRWIRRVLQGSLVLGLVMVLGRVLGRNEWARGLALVRAGGWPLLLLLLATPVALAFDAMAWRQILLNLGAPAAWWRLTRIRLISEAVVLALPGGTVMAEATKLTLLRRECAISPSTAAASLALARALHMAAAGAYLGLIAVLSWTLPEAAAPGWRTRLSSVAVAACLLTAVASRIVLALLREARMASRLADRLERLRWRRLSRAVATHRRHLEEIDDHTAQYFRASATARARAGVPFFVQWLVDGAETAVMLSLLGAHIGLRGALIVDGITSFARSAAVLVPAGLGVQEASQVFLLHVLGARDDVATGAALIFMKRMKELFWIVTGALLAAATKGSWPSKV